MKYHVMCSSLYYSGNEDHPGMPRYTENVRTVHCVISEFTLGIGSNNFLFDFVFLHIKLCNIVTL